MRLPKTLITIAALLLGMAWTVPAMAYGHYFHSRVGVFIGPGFGPWYYPWPYYYGANGPYPYYYGYGAPAYAPTGPTQYVEQGAVSAPQPTGSWYFCADPQGYYPYVQQCRTSWQRVSPTPPGMQ